MNHIAAVKFDKSTTNFDPKEELYWIHFLSRDNKEHTVRDYINSQIRKNPMLRRELLNQPVCPRCEGFTFFHKGGAMCPSCGLWTPENQTHSVKTHLREGWYK